MKSIWQLMDDQPTDQFSMPYTDDLMEPLVPQGDGLEDDRKTKAKPRRAPNFRERLEEAEARELWAGITFISGGFADDNGFERQILDIAG